MRGAESSAVGQFESTAIRRFRAQLIHGYECCRDFLTNPSMAAKEQSLRKACCHRVKAKYKCPLLRKVEMSPF
jgi:hypothetical protein